MTEYFKQASIAMTRTWDEEDWDRRQEMVAEVWHMREPEGRKEILALLITHAPEIARSD